MDPEITDQIFDELFPEFQHLETRTVAILQFLKEKGIANDDELAPYLEQAANASSVRWRVVRVRMARLLASLEKSVEQEVPKQMEQPAKEHAEKAKAEDKRPTVERDNKESETIPSAETRKDKQASGSGQDQMKPSDQASEKDRASSEDQERAKDQASEKDKGKGIPEWKSTSQLGEKPEQARTHQNLEGKESHPAQPGRKPAEPTKNREDAVTESNQSEAGEPERKRA
jgi:hypothetical protein